MIYKVQCRIMFLFGWLVVITGCFQGVRAGATPRTVVYIHVETHIHLRKQNVKITKRESAVPC